MKRNLPRV